MSAPQERHQQAVDMLLAAAKRLDRQPMTPYDAPLAEWLRFAASYRSGRTGGLHANVTAALAVARKVLNEVPS